MSPAAPVTVTVTVDDGKLTQVGLTNCPGQVGGRSTVRGWPQLDGHRAARLRQELHLHRQRHRRRRHGDGKWGQEDLNLHFTVGRAQIVKADVTSHRLVVVRDGKVVMDFPASYGLGSDPDRITRSGTHVVMSKSPLFLGQMGARRGLNLSQGDQPV